MKVEYKGPWFMGKGYHGEVNGYYFQAQVFDEPSKFGIAEGRISRLLISKSQSFGLRDCLINYDRGWDGGLPKGPIRSTVEKVIRYFDNKSVDWAFEERRHRGQSS